MDLRALQTRLTTLLDGIEHPRILAALALAEEAGEVARCVLDAEGYGKDVRAALEGELGDTLVALCEVASRYDLDLATAVEGTLRKLEAKAPVWRAEMGTRLVDLRRRLDGPT